MKLSVVIPVYREEGNISKLFERLNQTLSSFDSEYEIIAINDGSPDDSWAKLKDAAEKYPHIKLINFQRNFGQTAAMAAGISHSQGSIIIPMDSDLENDPADIPRLLEKMSEGYDVVSGWRQNRWANQKFTRKIPSEVANWLISFITGLKLHDYGCTLKAYKRDLIKDVGMYGEMHRFIPALAAWRKAKVIEIPVHYQPREYGESAYGFSRTFRVILDLVLIKFLSKYMNRPMHFFGGIGFMSLIIGGFSGILAVILKLASIRDFTATPLPVFTALFIIVGVQLVVMGILAEVIMRTYYESQNKTPYLIKEKVNF